MALAEASANKTPYEMFKISEVWAFLYGAQNNYRDVLKTYEAMLADPNNRQFLTAEQSANLAKQLPQLALSLQDYTKAIEYSQRWLVDHPNDSAMMALLGQSYYSFSNYQSCITFFRTAIETAERANTKPHESWLTTLRFCASKFEDTANFDWALERLCRYYPKPDYWTMYLRRVSWQERSDLAQLQWYRLMNDVDALKDADNYTDYAHQAVADYGVPAEAVRILEEGFEKRVLGSDEKKKSRHQRILVIAKEAAVADKANWTKLAADAEGDSTGQKNVQMGMAFFGAAQYDQAIAQLEKAIKKGGAKELANIKLTLAIAYLKRGNREAARSAFLIVAADPILGRVAHAWIVRTYN